MSTMMNGIKPPPASAVTQPMPTAIENTPKSKQLKLLFIDIILLFIIENTTKNPGFFTLGRKKNKNTRIDISAPVQSTYV